MELGKGIEIKEKIYEAQNKKVKERMNFENAITTMTCLSGQLVARLMEEKVQTIKDYEEGVWHVHRLHNTVQQVSNSKEGEWRLNPRRIKR